MPVRKYIFTEMGVFERCWINSNEPNRPMGTGTRYLGTALVLQNGLLQSKNRISYDKHEIEN